VPPAAAPTDTPTPPPHSGSSATPPATGTLEVETPPADSQRAEPSASLCASGALALLPALVVRRRFRGRAR
jgi:hypothetical protein